MDGSLGAIDTPALVIDLDIADANLRRMQRRADALGLDLWPHTKTHKLPMLAHAQIESGARGLTVAKLGEAEVLSAAGLKSIFIHYPILGEAKTARLASLLGGGTAVRIALDSVEAADAASTAAMRAGASVDVLVEVDTGGHRVGRQPGAPVAELAGYVAGRPGLRFAGLTSFAGHISGAPTEDARLEILRLEGEALADSKVACEAAGLPVGVVSVGGTHHAARMEQIPLATEVRPGTYVYNDRNILASGSCTLDECAATVLVTVVSRNADWAVVDGGSKTFSSDPSRLDGGFGVAVDFPGLVVAWCNEEHGVVTWPAGQDGPRVGQRLRILPNHACTTVNMHNEVVTVRGGVVVETVPVASRGFLR